MDAAGVHPTFRSTHRSIGEVSRPERRREPPVLVLPDPSSGPRRLRRHELHDTHRRALLSGGRRPFSPRIVGNRSSGRARRRGRVSALAAIPPRSGLLGSQDSRPSGRGKSGREADGRHSGCGRGRPNTRQCERDGEGGRVLFGGGGGCFRALLRPGDRHRRRSAEFAGDRAHEQGSARFRVA